jgi:hypothetical protein
MNVKRVVYYHLLNEGVIVAENVLLINAHRLNGKLVEYEKFYYQNNGMKGIKINVEFVK